MKKLFGKEKWAHLFYTVTHPADGYYWIRHKEKGSVAIAVLMVMIFGLCFSMNRLLASLGNYLYNNVESSNGYYDRMFQYGLHNLVVADYYFNAQQEVSDYYLRNASFLRCDNITLGYTWNNLLNNNLRLRLFAGVQNPFVITKYNGVDPEVFSGVDSSPYPRSTTYSLGLVATF